MEQQESADDAGGSTDAAPIGWLDEILPVDPDEDEYMPWCWDDLEARNPLQPVRISRMCAIWSSGKSSMTTC